MSAAVVLCRQSQGDSVLGIAAARNGNRLLVTIQGDGVVSYNISRLASEDTRALGSSQAQLLAPVQPLGSSYIAAVQPLGSPHGLLVCSPVKAKQPRPLLDAEQQIPLPSPLHSCHVLHGTGQQHPGCAALVFADGSVGSADFEDLCIRTCKDEVQSGAAASQHSGRTVAAAAGNDGQLLAVAHQAAAGADVQIAFYMNSSSTGQDAAEGKATLQAVHHCTLASVASSSRLSHMSVAAGVLALVWRDGSITTYHSSFADNCSNADHTANIPLPSALAAVVSGQQAASRKRRTADDAAPTAKVLCTAVSSTQLLLVTVKSPSEAHHAVVDSRYGCCLASGPLALGDAGSAAGTSSCAAELVTLGPAASAPAALRVGGTVYLLHLQLPKADLAGLVSQLAVSHNSNREPMAAAEANSMLTGRQQINLAAVVSAVATTQQKACVFQSVPDSTVSGVDEAGSATSNSVAASVQQLATVLAQQPIPASELVQAAQQLVSSLQQQANHSTQQKQQKPAARRVQQYTDDQVEHQQQLPAGAAAALISQRLLAQGLAALADVAEWAVLHQLHQLQPLQSLAACPTLLPDLAAAQQYQLMRQVLLNTQEVTAESLISAVQVLLQQTPSSLAARQAEGAGIREVAAAAVQAAEQAVAAGVDVAAGPLLSMASRAAAAVDGFTATEMLLHVLVAAPVDAVEAQAALKQLPASLVLRLLRYLHKWVQKYTTLPRNEATAASSWAEVGLVGSIWDSSHAQALLAMPNWGQILEWARLVLDAHLTTLAMLPAATVLLQSMKRALQLEVGASSKLVALKGIADHLAMGAPLPMVAEAANSEYTLELLDLRVAGRS